MDSYRMHQIMIGALKGNEWEKAKGQLRAVLSLAAAETGLNSVERYTQLSDMIEQFITEVEEEGLDE